MKVAGCDWRAVFWQKSRVHWVEQRLLPHDFKVVASSNPEQVAAAIETMQVRGAPTIGATAAYGLALAFAQEQARFFDHWLPRFRCTRPTAVNLFHACDYLQKAATDGANAKQMVEAAKAYADAEVARNQRMGEVMAEYLAIGRRRILTHCNAGWLAAVDWGTALAGIYQMARSGESPFVWVDETRPRLQGAKLTAWELVQEGIDCRLQVDNAAAWMMARGEVDAVVVGADRIAANGDVANKIGTYSLSLAAREHGVPFYVVAPSTTFDADCATGAAIPIEERAAEEVLALDVGGKSMPLAPVGVGASNPAFDITPAVNISAIASEKGVWRP